MDIKWAREELAEQELVLVALEQQVVAAESYLDQLKQDFGSVRGELRRKKTVLKTKEAVLAALRERENNVSRQNMS